MERRLKPTLPSHRAASGHGEVDKGKNERQEGCAKREGDVDRGGKRGGGMAGRGEGERGMEPSQEIDFPGLAGNGDTRSPIVSPH